MIEPEVTAVLGRRLLAFLIDSSLVAATGLGVAFQRSSAFAVVGRDSDDNALVDPGEFSAIEELLDFELFGRSEILGIPVVRAQELGDSYRVFAADSYQSGLLAALVAALVLFGLVPMVLRRTLGMVPVGIGIRKTDGTRAGIGAHLVRTVVGFIDAIPLVIPGALGFITARASKHRQRLGDRVAKTVVVNIKALRDSDIAGERIDLGQRVPDERVLDDLDADSDRASTPSVPPTGLDGASTFTADAPTAPEAVPAPPAPGAPPAPAPAVQATPPVAEKPPMAKPTFGDPLPPPPVHRKGPSEPSLGTPSDRSLDLTAPATEDAPDFQSASEVDAPTATAAEHLLAQQSPPLDSDAVAADKPGDLAIPDGTWQPPREEPAPVWQPTTLETAPIESPDPHDGRTIDDIERIDPSIGALLAEDSAGTNASGSTRGGKHSQQETSAKTPVWSDKWRAWMYWDSSRKCWLRHDTTSNTWLPVD